jgi:hypothetical protein
MTTAKVVRIPRAGNLKHSATSMAAPDHCYESGSMERCMSNGLEVHLVLGGKNGTNSS